MYYLLVDSYGASLAAYPSKGQALRAYYAMIRENTTAVDEVSLLECDSEGTAVNSVAAPL